ncbi:50S ribosomal protein L15 [candidate division WWE3 bacterium]|nr:50S ribosomal protein L15 [candidate division WWE3 bacterium]
MSTVLHKLTKVVHPRGKRVGRGYSSGKGKTSGRGQTGQRARNHVAGGFEGGQTKFVIRLPFLRGKQFRSSRVKPTSLNISQIDKFFDTNAVITLDGLKEKNLVSNKVKVVKVLSYGLTTKAFVFDGPFKFSRKALEKITKAGGSVKESAPSEQAESPKSTDSE